MNFKKKLGGLYLASTGPPVFTMCTKNNKMWTKKKIFCLNVDKKKSHFKQSEKTKINKTEM